MIIELIIALLLGCTIGTFTGLAPGIHINLISAILLVYLPGLSSKFSLLFVAIFIVSMSTTHTFLDFIPSVFLGAPDEDTFLSVMPGHQMLKEGKAHEAVMLTLYGSLLALPIILIFSPAFVYIMPLIYESAKSLLPYLLIFIGLYAVFREDRVLLAITIFLMSGFIGLISLNLPVNQPMLPLLSGLFGASSLILAVKQKSEIPKQEFSGLRDIKVSRKDFFRASLGSIFSAPLCSFLPGVGSGHAAAIGSEIIEQTQKSFLILLGAINTIVMGLSFITIFSIGRARTGSALAVKNILETISVGDIITIITSIIFSGFLSFLIGIKISKYFSAKISKINYSVFSLFVIGLLAAIVPVFSGWIGMIIFITSTSLGLFTILSGTRRINLMGSLLIPTIIFYLVG